MKPTIGVLLVHLGTPTDISTKSVRQFLKEFLSDPYVIRVPKIPWQIFLHGFILRTRPSKIANLYRTIWTKEGSPLFVIANRQQQKLQEVFSNKNILVETSMRYGTPSICDALLILKNKGIDSLVVLPLFPQYSQTTTASILNEVHRIVSAWNAFPSIHWITNYHSEPSYIEALANSVRYHWECHGQGERLLVSYHGIPFRYHNQGDPYYFECQETTALLAQDLKLKHSTYGLAFQSRFAFGKWLYPSTQNILVQWASDGVRRVDVLTPGFSADCLETLEEINIRGRKIFLDAGGKSFHFISPLNDSPDHIKMMKKLILNRLKWET